MEKMPEPRQIHVCGPIGVGKSSLVRALGDAGWTAHPETIPMHLFDAYVASTTKDRALVAPGDPHRATVSLAWSFQVVMMDRAIQRSEAAGAAPTQRHVIERPWYENQVFAYANYQMGMLSEAEYTAYQTTVELCRASLEHRAPDETHAIFLWAPSVVCIGRMAERGRANEGDYAMGYLDYLVEAYFLLLLQSHVFGTELSLPPLRVVDWREYGTATTPRVTTPAHNESRLWWANRPANLDEENECVPPATHTVDLGTRASWGTLQLHLYDLLATPGNTVYVTMEPCIADAIRNAFR